MIAGNANLRAIVRVRDPDVRPDNACRQQHKIHHGHSMHIIDPSGQSIAIRNKLFAFDRCYPTYSTTSEIFAAEIYPVLEQFVTTGYRYNLTLLAYGQTGSGKTFTMLGEGRKEAPGLIQFTLQHLFGMAPIKMEMEFSEIYCNQSIQLVAATEIKSVEDANRLLLSGVEKRATASTRVHDYSSRSHAIITVKFEREGIRNEIVLVDLAGSERLKKTKLEVGGTRFQESVQINQSLLALANVIRSLSSRRNGDQHFGDEKHVPYRSSKLTWHLQNALGGNSITLLIACVSPLEDDYEETINTLTYATQARNIKNAILPNYAQPSAPKQEIAVELSNEELQDRELFDGAEQTPQWLQKYKTALRQRTLSVLNLTSQLATAQSENNQLKEMVQRLEDKLQETCVYLEKLDSETLKSEQKSEVFDHEKFINITSATLVALASPLVEWNAVEQFLEPLDNRLLKDAFSTLFSYQQDLQAKIEELSTIENSRQDGQRLVESVVDRNVQEHTEGRQRTLGKVPECTVDDGKSNNSEPSRNYDEERFSSDEDNADVQSKTSIGAEFTASNPPSFPEFLRLKRKLRDAERELGQLRASHVEHDAHLSNLREEFEAIINHVQQSSSNEIEQITQEYEERLKSTDDGNLRQELEKMRNEYEIKLKEWQHRYDELNERWNENLVMKRDDGDSTLNVIRKMIEMKMEDTLDLDPAFEKLKRLSSLDNPEDVLSILLDHFVVIPKVDRTNMHNVSTSPLSMPDSDEKEEENNAKRLNELERDLFYYRQTNRELKQKLREFMSVYEKHAELIKRERSKRKEAEERLRQLTAPITQGREMVVESGAAETSLVPNHQQAVIESQ